MRDVGDDSFEREVLQADRPVLVDFWAPWCGPCHAITPVLQSLEDELGDRIDFVKVNIDVNPVTASRYGVLSIPTVILFRGGEAKDSVLGARARPHYERLLGEVLPAT